MPTAVRKRAQPPVRRRRTGKARRGRPGSQETCHGRSPQALVERGRLMLTQALPNTFGQSALGAAKQALRLRRALAVVVVLVGLLLSTGSAIAAAPATVTVRV